MPELTLNGRRIVFSSGTTVAAAIWNAGAICFRHGVSGEARAPLCGMGICMECRVTIDGRMHQRSCQVFAEPGMVIETT